MTFNFDKEILEAIERYDRHIVCLVKTPDEFKAQLRSLLTKALKAYDDRDPGYRHGIALDHQITVILSEQPDTPQPLCGIYFNLSSPYVKRFSDPKNVV